ncbi:MAG: Maf family protein [Candidatus Lokiarchaeota archaeon]
MMQIILASKSQDRRKILENLRIPFKIVPSHIDESKSHDKIRDPIELVQKLAELKAKNVQQQLMDRNESGIIIAADTIVELNGEIIGKAKTKKDAFKTLQLLSGLQHNLITGFAIISLKNSKTYVSYDKTKVKFIELSQNDIKNYIRTDEWKGRAGAYSLRERASVFIESIKGSFSNVLGLPVDKIFQILLDKFGVNLLSL